MATDFHKVNSQALPYISEKTRFFKLENFHPHTAPRHRMIFQQPVTGPGLE